MDEDYDPWTDPTMETCSWCLEPVPEVTLREQKDGARICRQCREIGEPPC